MLHELSSPTGLVASFPRLIERFAYVSARNPFKLAYNHANSNLVIYSHETSQDKLSEA